MNNAERCEPEGRPILRKEPFGKFIEQVIVKKMLGLASTTLYTFSYLNLDRVFLQLLHI